MTRRGWPSRLAWAIECEPGHLIGVYWFNSAPLLKHLDGYRSATFATRRAARVALKQVKGSYRKARVVRVRVCLDMAPTAPEGAE
jgi:hypothetical protein